MQLPPMYSAVKINGQPLLQGGPQGPDGGAHTPAPSRCYSIDYLGSPAPGDYTLRIACLQGAPTSGCWPRISAQPWACRPRWLRCAVPGAGCPSRSASAIPCRKFWRRPRPARWRTAAGILPVETVFAPLPALTVNDGVKAHLFNGCPTSHYAAADGRYRTYDQAGQFLGLAGGDGGRAAGGKNSFVKGRKRPMQIYPCHDAGAGPAGVRGGAGIL